MNFIELAQIKQQQYVIQFKMSRRGQQKQDRKREQQYIDAIQSQYLTHRFARIMAILSKNYLYSYNLLVNVNSLYASSFKHKMRKFGLLLASILHRHKKNLLRYLLRNLERKQLSKQKSSAFIFEIIQRKVSALDTVVLSLLKQVNIVQSTLLKNQQLFLRIALSNIVKIYNSSKIEALEAIKYGSYQKKVAINKAKIIILEFNLSKILHSSMRKVFNKLSQIYNPQLVSSEDEENESDQQDIMVQCFKSLAVNLRSIKQKKKESRDIVMVKKEEGAKSIFEAISSILNEKLRWTFWELKSNCRTEYTPETYQILVRQIVTDEVFRLSWKKSMSPTDQIASFYTFKTLI